MKKMYWHSHRLPRYFIAGLCLISIIGMFCVEHFKKYVPQHYYKEKTAAANLSKDGFLVVKERAHRLKMPINSSNDPQKSGLVGQQLTIITSDQGNLLAKQTSVNPNIAAIFVDWLKQLGLKKGDTVAVGMTGSFPALDISMLSAFKTLELNPLLIFSTAASQYGANVPGFTWIDMYTELYKKRIFDYQPIAVSLGGRRDEVAGMSDAGKQILINTIKRYRYNFLDVTGTVDSINKRMELYKANSKGQPIAAYINIGGGMASIGLKRIPGREITTKRALRRHSLPAGVVLTLPVALANTDSEAVRFLKKGIPVINVRDIVEKMRTEYNLPPNPKITPMIGWGSIFFHEEYNKGLAAIVLLIIVISLCVLTWLSKRYLIRFISAHH